MIVATMENLPFLSNDAPSQSRSAPQHESEWPEPQPREREFQVQPRAKDPFEVLKDINPVGLILIGIVIGTLIISMRPIVVQSK